MTYPRIVTTTDINFSQYPELGLASLILEAGYTEAELFISLLKDLFNTKSVFSYLKLYALITSPSVSICLYMFARLLGEDNQTEWYKVLTAVIPKYTTGFSNALSLAESADDDSYREVLTWFGYTNFNYQLMLDDPYILLDWINGVQPNLMSLNTAFKTAEVTQFIVALILYKTGIDFTLNNSAYLLLKRWVNLAFTRYAFGSSINQLDWF